MEEPPLISFSILTILVLFSAYFSASETAFSSLNRIRIKHLAEEGSARAALVLKLHEDYDRLISAILVGNNVVNICIASLSTVLGIRYYAERGPLIATILITIVLLLFAEITPKILSKEAPESFALFAAPTLQLLVTLLVPVQFLVGEWKKFLGRFFRTQATDRGLTEQELLSIVEEAGQDGAIDEEDLQLIVSAIEYNDLKAEDILTPRMKIVGAQREITPEALAELLLDTGYSRIPIFEENLDHIVGVVHLRDLLQSMVKKESTITGIISPAVFVAPSAKISDLFKLLQREKSHLVIVTDEYGGTSGIVTMEDILEELVGEIWDESDEIVEEFIAIGDSTYRVSGEAEIDKMFDFLGLEESIEEIDASTVSGWIMDVLEKIPEPGDAFSFGPLRVEVSKTEERMVLECLVHVQEV